MKRVKLFEQFINESTVNLYSDWDKDTTKVAELLAKDPDIKIVDAGYLEVNTPFEIHPNTKNENYKNTIGLVLYYELLSYSYSYDREEQTRGEHLTPWVAIKMEFEDSDGFEFTKEVAEFLKNKIESNTGLKMFQDEDATFMNWGKDNHNGWTSYTGYINPDIPEGWWQNHTIN